ncbi:unnamed protein product [Pylaiella littoralis]
MGGEIMWASATLIVRYWGPRILSSLLRGGPETSVVRCSPTEKRSQQPVRG